MAFLSDSFTEASGTPLLDAHTGETGATWTKHPNSGVGTIGIGSAIDRARVVTANGVMLYTASGSSASADYDVQGVVFCATVVGQNCGVIGRVDTAADTYYAFFYSVTNLRWELRKQVAGVGTALASSLATLTPGNSYAITLRMIGSSIKGFVGGVEVCSVTDTSITAAGKAGVRMQGTMSDSTSVHLDSIAAVNVATAAAAISGTGSISATGRRTVSGVASIAGAGSISATGVRRVFAAASIIGTGAVSAAGTRKTFAVAAIAGTGGLNAAGNVTHLGAGAISGAGAITATGLRTVVGVAHIGGEGSISATPLLEIWRSHPGEDWSGTSENNWPEAAGEDWQHTPEESWL